MTRAAALVLALAACGDPSLRAADGDVAGDADGQKVDDPAEVADATVPETSVADTSVADSGTPYPTAVTEGLVRGVDNAFWQNMDDFVFGRVMPAEVRLYVAVLNANHFAQEPYRAYGADLIRHPESYFANVLVPFVERYRDALWAIDCMNEPEAIIAGPDGNYAAWGVSWDEMRAYLSACAAVVRAHGGGVPVSAGSGWHDWHNLAKGHYDGLGFDFLDAHVYLDTWDLPPASSLAAIPVIIGECGQKTEVRDDTRQQAATRACFAQAAERGYRAALSWYYDYAGSTNHLAAKNADGSWRPFAGLFAEYAGAAPGFETGLNLAWIGGAYDHDFAPNPLHPEWGSSYAGEVAGAIVSDYDATGIAVMRLWAFEGQEALPFHAIYADFEADFGGFDAADRTTVSLARTSEARAPDGGVLGLSLAVATTKPGWQGIERAFSAEMPLNLAHASAVSFFAEQSLGVGAGVNLYFVVGEGDQRVTYQTTEEGQLWLADGASGSREVGLGAADFARFWARESAPAVGVARPDKAALEDVRAIGVRVYVPDARSGSLAIDSLRVF